MMNCLILGGGGFIGSHLADALVERGCSVRIFGDFKSGLRKTELISDKIQIIKGDFLNPSDLTSAIKDIDCIFHYISTTNPASSFDSPVYDIETNIIGSVKMMEIALKSGVNKIVFPSTGGTIYGNVQKSPISENEPLNPQNPYAISKMTIEQYLNYFYTHYGMDYLILRYSNPYGERQNPSGNQGVIPIFLNKIRHNESPVVYGDGNSVRDYIYINDAIEATISVLEHKTQEKLFNIGSGTGTSLNQLLMIMSSVTGKRATPVYKEDGGRYINRIILDISKIRKETGWQPKTNISEGIARTWKWLNQRNID